MLSGRDVFKDSKLITSADRFNLTRSGLGLLELVTNLPSLKQSRIEVKVTCESRDENSLDTSVVSFFIRVRRAVPGGDSLMLQTTILNFLSVLKDLLVLAALGVDGLSVALLPVALKITGGSVSIVCGICGVIG